MAAGLKLAQSWGLASARHTSGFVPPVCQSPYMIDVPLGPSVARWNVKAGEREIQFQVDGLIKKHGVRSESCLSLSYPRLGSFRSGGLHVTVT